MEILRLSKPDRHLRCDIALDGSKSLSNRALIVLALAGEDPTRWLSHLSGSRDTSTLRQLLRQNSGTFDAGDAGTTFRFLTAYLALQPGEQVLTGSARMRERPVGALVQALRDLGADIEFLEKEGYPPLRIGAPERLGKTGRSVRIDAGVSSQFLSALLLIGPCLPGGLELIPEGSLVSRPYLDMTLRMMHYFGAEAAWHGDRILIQPGHYQPRPLMIEADWSAASYWYAMAAMAEDADLTLRGLYTESWQGDSVLIPMMARFGVSTTPSPEGDGIRLRKQSATPHPSGFEWNFLECPDLAQTLAIACAGLGIPGVFSGLETLAIKETDRTAALRTELAKVGATLEEEQPALAPRAKPPAVFLLQGKAVLDAIPLFSTYGDHRMAMALATLAMLGTVDIEHPEVVQKSYPAFWQHLEQAGFSIKKRDHA